MIDGYILSCVFTCFHFREGEMTWETIFLDRHCSMITQFPLQQVAKLTYWPNPIIWCFTLVTRFPCLECFQCNKQLAILFTTLCFIQVGTMLSYLNYSACSMPFFQALIYKGAAIKSKHLDQEDNHTIYEVNVNSARHRKMVPSYNLSKMPWCRLLHL